MSRELIEVPLNKLVPSDRNVRRTGAADGVEELAASILAHGLLQPLLVVAREGGRYAVIAGSRRLMALRLLTKRKVLPRSFTVPVMVREVGEEESLAENVVRMPLHPADQFEAFRRLELSGLGLDEIAARFGVSLRTVRQRLALGAVSANLMQAYREGKLSLAQLEAFTVTDDPVRQDEVYQGLGSFREPWRIKAALTQADVSGRDRRAQFLGLDAYEIAGGGVLRDLFSTTDEVWLTDVALLDRLSLGKLGEIADEMRKEGWLWTQALLDFPHGHGCGRVYPHAVEQDRKTVARRVDAVTALETLYREHPDDEVSEEVTGEMARLEEEIARLSEQAYAYDPAAMSRAGAFVVLGHGSAGGSWPERQRRGVVAGRAGEGRRRLVGSADRRSVGAADGRAARCARAAARHRAAGAGAQFDPAGFLWPALRRAVLPDHQDRFSLAGASCRGHRR